MLQTLEPRWTLQAAPVGRLFVSSKSDLAHIVGIASQRARVCCRHPMPVGLGRRQPPLPRHASTSQNGLLPTLAGPQPFTQRQLQVCHSGVLWLCSLPLASAQTMA